MILSVNLVVSGDVSGLGCGGRGGKGVCGCAVQLETLDILGDLLSKFGGKCGCK